MAGTRRKLLPASATPVLTSSVCIQNRRRAEAAGANLARPVAQILSSTRQKLPGPRRPSLSQSPCFHSALRLAFSVQAIAKQGKVAENLLSEGIEDWAGYLSLFLLPRPTHPEPLQEGPLSRKSAQTVVHSRFIHWFIDGPVADTNSSRSILFLIQ